MSLFDNDDRSRLIELQIEAVKRALGQTGVAGGRALTSTIPTPFEQGLTRGPVNMQGMSDAQTQSLINQRLDARSFGTDDDIDLPDQGADPFETGEFEDSVFDILVAIMTGTQGTIEGLDPETIEALQTAVEGSSAEELERIAQEIAEAGGYEEWLAQQPTGDPGDVEPPPAPEPEPEEEPEVVQVPISEADFNEQFPNVDPSEYTESGTWTDPETGIVYVINIPPPEIEETEEEEGGGGEEAPTEEEGEPTEDQPEEEEVIVDPTDSTVDDEDAETGDTIPPDTIEEQEPEEPAEEEVTPSPFFRVENGQVYVLDYETGEYVLADPAVYEGYLGRNPEDGVYTDQGVRIEDEDIILELPPLPEQEDTGIVVPSEEEEEEDEDVIFDPRQTPDFPGGDAPIPEQEPAEEPAEEPVEEEVPAEEPEQPTEETEPTPSTEQPTEQPTPTEEAPETSEQPGTETPSDTPTTGTDETGTAGEDDAPTTGTGSEPGEGEDGNGTGDGEKRDGLFDDYQEFMTSIGYQPVQLQQLIAPPKKDYFRELDNLIGRSLFGKMI